MIQQREVRNFLIALLGGVWAAAAPVVLAADAPAPTEVAVVIILEGPASLPPLYDKYAAVYKKYGMNVDRKLWYQGFAGAESGHWVSVVTYANMQDFAKSGTVVDSPEYQALNAELQQKGFRTVSTSLQFRAR